MIHDGFIYLATLMLLAAILVNLPVYLRGKGAQTFFKFAPPIVLIYLGMMLLCTMKVWDLQDTSAVYVAIKNPLLYAMLFLMLLRCDLKKIIKLGPKMLIGFFSASISIGIGFVVSYGIFHKLLGPDSWKALAALCGSWLGGGSNMLAVQAILDVSEESLAYALVMDSVCAVIYVITTETGAGQWGASLAYAARLFGLEAAVYQVKISYEQKPYRRSIMQTFGAQVTPSPSMSTRAGKDILTAHPNHQGSLGTAISEAIELARTTPNCKYTLGSVLSHVTLHQTVIGLEAEKQMQMAGEYPDMVIACFGGGSNFGGIAFPFMRHTILEGKKTRFIAAEPASCPKLTRGKFQYDFGDEAGYTPLLPMFTLGHNFAPANIHAGGLRYHGAGVIVSQLLKDGYMEATDIKQLESFEAGCLFAQAEGIIPAPESCHAIAATVREANKCKETGEEKVILFNLSGHGLIDMASYDKYLAGDLQNYELTDNDIRRNLDEIGNLV